MQPLTRVINDEPLCVVLHIGLVSFIPPEHDFRSVYLRICLHRPGYSFIFGKGISGFIGRRLSKKLNIPKAGKNDLIVDISHQEDGMHWDRSFNHVMEMKSIFEPIGNIKNGYWLERTGPLHMKLTVEIKDGGWYWNALSYKFLGITLPNWLLPQSEAYKYIENGKYRFCVAFSAPFLGKLLSYSGLLSMES